MKHTIQAPGSIAFVMALAACGSAGSMGSGAMPVAAVASGGSAVNAAPSAPMAVEAAPSVAGAMAESRSESTVATASPEPPAASAGAAAAVAMPAPSAATVAVATTPAAQPPRAGVLTAASVGDADRRDNYLEYLARHPGEREALGIDMTRRVRFRVVDGQHRPIANARVTLTGEHGVRVTGRTHADGGWDFHPSLYEVAPQVLSARIEAGRDATDVRVAVDARGDAQDVTVALQHASGQAPRALDLGFAIDVTGSMGDELRYVNAEIADIVARIEAQSPGVRVRVGATFYRDRFDAQPLDRIAFTPDVRGFASEMQRVVATGGGDYPEDMNRGLDAALHGMQWDDADATDRVLVLIADAPPQMYRDEQFTYRSAMYEAAARGIRILPVAASGADRTVEYLFRAMGAATSTPYVYLTDDSGVGAPHMEADTDRVAVERFNNLLVRVVTSDLHGLGMHEPGPLGPQG